MHSKLTIVCRNLCIGAAIGLAAPATASAATDPLLAQQWGLDNPAATGAQEAWTQSHGAGVLVAVLDTGVQLDHPDLAGAIWTNPSELPGNGVDDDRNGFVDDVHGANMFKSNGDINDDNDHGTHVAGIVAARIGNGTGGAGMAPEAKVLPVKVLDSGMNGSTDTLARGIRYAVDRGAKILSVSINTDTATDAVKGAVRYAGDHGAVIVAASGNNGRNIDLLPSYPASLTDPAILAVGATTSSLKLWSSSNTGLLSVDLAAPGAGIVSTAPGSKYQSRTGTSAATPFVAGALALLSSARPDLPMSTLRTTVIETARRENFLSATLGGGNLDVGAAMHKVLAGRPWRTATATEGSTVAPKLKLSGKAKVRSGSRIKLRWAATGAETVMSWQVSLDRKVVATVPATAAGVSRRSPRAGSHRWKVVGLNAAGDKVVSAQRKFKVMRRK